MARRGRRKGKTTANIPGYPTNKELRKQAGAIANASVPTVRATTRPFKRQQQSVAGFLDAALSALRDSQAQVGQTYDTAGASQQAITAAAQARLSSLGLGEYAAGTQAAEGARSDSAAAQLNQMGASAKTYASRQPGIATGYAALQNASIQKNLKDALAQRVDERRTAYMQGLQTVQAQAMDRLNYLAGRQDAATQRSQFATSTQLQEEQIAEQRRQFEASQAQDAYYHSPKYLKIVQAIQDSGQASGDTSGLTNFQIHTMAADAGDTILGSVNGVKDGKGGWTLKPNKGYGNNGANIENVWKQLTIGSNIPPSIVLSQMSKVYSPQVFLHFLRRNQPQLANRVAGLNDILRAAEQAGKTGLGKVKGPHRGA